MPVTEKLEEKMNACHIKLGFISPLSQTKDVITLRGYLIAAENLILIINLKVRSL